MLLIFNFTRLLLTFGCLYTCLNASKVKNLEKCLTHSLLTFVCQHMALNAAQTNIFWALVNLKLERLNTFVSHCWMFTCSSKAAKCVLNFAWHVYYWPLNVYELVWMLPQHIQIHTFCTLINYKISFCSNFCLKNILLNIQCF